MSAEQSVTMAECLSLVADELTVLESIYDSLLTVHPTEDKDCGRMLSLDIPITLLSPTSTQISTSFAAGAASSSALTSLELLHLPPIKVRLHLPSLYPLRAPPKILSIRAPLPSLPGAWLSKRVLAHVADRMRTMWQEEIDASGESSGVVWKWWEWVGTGDFLSEVGVASGPILRLSTGPNTPLSTFYTGLKTYNASQIQSSFASTAFSCAICLEDRKGKGCIQMPGCGCVFCVPCLSSGWTLAITEGSLENVFCPSVACTKERAIKEEKTGDSANAITASLVESVVGQGLRERWEWITENRKAETDPTYTICPQPGCQKPVPPPAVPSADEVKAYEAISKRAIRLSDISKPSIPPTITVISEPATPPPIATEDRWERYRRCPSCHYSFCLYCSATWHGPHTPCAFSTASAIVQEYLSYPEGSSERLKMEARRGKSNLDRMVSKWQEEEDNKKWLEEKTKACAGCGVRVEKSHGCNHMTCGRCGAHFCYRCGASISPQDPYAHYRKPGQPCFERLFDPEEILRFEREAAVRGFDGLPDFDGAW